MPKFPLIGPSYTSQSSNADAQSTINLYPERIELGMGNNEIVLYPAPGLKSFVILSPVGPPIPPADIPVFGSFFQMVYVGTSSGNSRTNVPWSTGEIFPGDLVIFTVTSQLSTGNTFPIVGVSESVTGATYSALPGSGVTYNAAYDIFPALGKQLYLFYGTATNHVPVGNYVMTITWGGSNTNGDANGWFFPVRFLTTLHVSAASTQTVNTPDTSYSGSPVTPSVYTGLISLVQGAGTTTANSPLLRKATGIGDRGSVGVYSLAGSTQAPPALYTPSWNNFPGGPVNEARMLTAAFVNAP